MNKSLITIAVMLALGMGVAHATNTEATDTTSANAKTKTKSLLATPAVPPQIATPAGKLPQQVQVPQTGVNRAMPMNQDLIKNHNAARAAKDMQQLQKMQEMQRALQPGNRAQNNELGMSGVDGTAGSLRDSVGGHSTSTRSGEVKFGDGVKGRRPNGPVDRNAVPRDFKAGMTNSVTGKHPGGFSSQPSSPASGLNVGDRSKASVSLTKTNNHKNEFHKASKSETTTTKDTNGNSNTVTTVHAADGSSNTTASIVRPDGSSRNYETRTSTDGSSRTTMTERNADGKIVGKEATEHDSNGNEIQRGQPNENAPSASNDDCNWNPVWGRCTKQQKPSQQDMTSQPGKNHDGSKPIGGGFAGRLGNEAVTNGGDGSWSANRPGGSKGVRIDMRDPSIGSPDGAGPGTPGQ